MMHRRSFLKSCGAAMAAVVLGPMQLATASQGKQTFDVRSDGVRKYRVLVNGHEVAASRANARKGWAKIYLLKRFPSEKWDGWVLKCNSKSGQIPIPSYGFSGSKAIVRGKVEIIPGVTKESSEEMYLYQQSQGWQ